MADEVARGPRDSADWHPSKYALWSERWGDAANTPTSILLRHPTAPFLKTVPAVDDFNMQGVGNEYIEAVAKNRDIDPPIDLPKVFTTNSRDFFKRRHFAGLMRWMPLRWPPAHPGGAKAGDPFVSFRVERKSRAGAVVDQTVILVASEWIPDPGSHLRPPGHFLGSGFGIRVVAHVRPKNGKYEIRITGMTASLPFGPYSTAKVFDLLRKDRKKAFAPIFRTASLSKVKAEMSEQLDLKNQSVSIRGVRIATTSDGKTSRRSSRGCTRRHARAQPAIAERELRAMTVRTACSGFAGSQPAIIREFCRRRLRNLTASMPGGRWCSRLGATTVSR